MGEGGEVMRGFAGDGRHRIDAFRSVDAHDASRRIETHRSEMGVIGSMHFECENEIESKWQVEGGGWVGKNPRC